jgi:hypothetical protein
VSSVYHRHDLRRVAAHQQRNCRSSGKVLNLQIVSRLPEWRDLANGEMLNNKDVSREMWPTARNRPRFQRRRRARRHATKALSAFAASLEQRRLADDEVERDVGEPDALGRHGST